MYSSQYYSIGGRLIHRSMLLVSKRFKMVFFIFFNYDINYYLNPPACIGVGCKNYFSSVSNRRPLPCSPCKRLPRARFAVEFQSYRLFWLKFNHFLILNLIKNYADSLSLPHLVRVILKRTFCNQKIQNCQQRQIET